MAVDEALVGSANGAGQGGVIRFYQWRPATVSLGYFQRLRDRKSNAGSLNCPLVRRSTGGGAIIHDRELTYSLTLPVRRHVDAGLRDHYLAFHQALIDSLRDFASFSGASAISAVRRSRKCASFAGCSSIRFRVSPGSATTSYSSGSSLWMYFQFPSRTKRRGLEPNVFYGPPMSPSAMDAKGRPTGEPRIPTAMLEGLFGPRVREALATVEAERAKRKRGEASELMDILIAYDWNESFQLGMGGAAEPNEERA